MIPTAPGIPLLGNAFRMSRDIRDFLTTTYLALGPVFRIRILHRRYTVLAGVDANRFMNRDGIGHLRSFEFWSRFNARLGAARSLVSDDGADHAELRKLLRRCYSRQYATDRAADFAAIARRHMQGWLEGRPLPVRPALQQIATDQAGTLLSGVSPLPYLNDVAYYFRTLVADQVIPNPALLTPRFRRAARRVHELYEKVVGEHTGQKRKGADEEHDLIDEILGRHASDPQRLPESDLKVAVLGPFIAALDTVSSTLAFMIYALLKHPDVLEKVRREADRLFAGGLPTLEGLREMDATHRAAMETMRMWPIAPLLFRTVTNPFDFSGYHIPAGENVIIATTVPHYLPECFPDPYRFDIERYTPERAEHRRPEVYAPFGLGTHRCLGAGFAEIQMATTIATLFHDLDLSLSSPNYTLKTTQVPLPSPRDSFKVRVRRRR